MYNELYTSYTLPDGRVFEAKLGKVSAQIGYEDHGMFVMKFSYDWGLITSTHINLDEVVDYESDPENLERTAKDYLYPLIVSVLKVFGVQYGYFNSIRDAPVYILFSEERELHNQPLGFVNMKDTQNAFIFSDFFEKHGAS